MRILLADFDAARSKALGAACEGQGHQVVYAPHGAAALELALEVTPDTVICPVDLSVIDGARLEEILRGNPRTRHASFVFLVKDEMDAPISMDARDSTVVSPWRSADVLDLIEASVARTQRFGGARPNTEIEGNLSQISVVDLLEIFQMNRKSGTVKIWSSSPGAAGSIVVQHGQVVDASVPLASGTSVVGEKALYRLLGWKEGRFEFQPGELSEPGRIHKPTRALLLEGLRQLDEWEKIRSQLPSPDARIVLRVSKSQIPTDAHPLTREVIEGVENYRRVAEVVDHCSFPDYQVMRVLAGLMARGLLQHEAPVVGAEGRRVAAGAGILTASQLRRLREWASSQRPRPGSIIKVLVAVPSADAAGRFHDALRESPDFMSDPRLLRGPERLDGLIVLGHFPLGEGMSLRLVTVPSDPAYAPLWDLAGYCMLGAVVLEAEGVPFDRNAAVWRRLGELSGRRVVCLHLDEGLPPRDDSGASGKTLLLPHPTTGGRVPVLAQLFEVLVP